MQIERLVRDCQAALDQAGLFGMLRCLNHTTPYRFTGIYQFDNGWVKSVWLYDRENPHVEFGSDVLWDDSYCRMTAGDGDSCEIVDALRDERLTTHAARVRVQSYVAVLLRNSRDGSAFGTLCHFDVCPRTTPPGTLDTLRAIRPLLERTLAT